MKKCIALILALLLTGLFSLALAEEINWRALEGGELMVYGGSDEPHVAAVCKVA